MLNKILFLLHVHGLTSRQVFRVLERMQMYSFLRKVITENFKVKASLIQSCNAFTDLIFNKKAFLLPMFSSSQQFTSNKNIFFTIFSQSLWRDAIPWLYVGEKYI